VSFEEAWYVLEYKAPLISSGTSFLQPSPNLIHIWCEKPWSPKYNPVLGPDLQNILRQSYDNTKVTIDLRRTSNLQKHPTKGAKFFLGTIHLQTSKIVLDGVRKLAYDIPKSNFSTF